MMYTTAFALLLLGLAACARTPEQEGESSAVPPFADRDWELVSVGDLDNPRGAQDRPATIRFDSTAARAGGFAGCNRFSAGYTLRGNTIAFDPAVATKMLCPDAMALETSFLGALEGVTRYEATDSTLTLFDATGPVARFRASSP